MEPRNVTDFCDSGEVEKEEAFPSSFADSPTLNHSKEVSPWASDRQHCHKQYDILVIKKILQLDFKAKAMRFGRKEPCWQSYCHHPH